MKLGTRSRAFGDMIKIRITSDPRLLVIIRAVVAHLCTMENCSDEDQRKIVLAVDEACANIIKHTYKGDRSQTIDARFEIRDESLEVVLLDNGPPLDVACVQPRDLDEVRPGGLGTHFMRSIMDEVEFSCKEGSGNVLRMVKHLRKHSAQG